MCVCRDVKPGNIVSFGSSGTFKLIDMDSIYYTHDWEDDEEDEQPTQAAPPAEQQPPQPQQRRRRRPLGGMRGDPCPASLSAHLAGDAAALQLQQQTPNSAATSSSTAAPKQQQQQLNALSFAGTPENMAPEVAPTVLQLAVVLFDLFPLKEGQQVASSTAVAPAQDIWSTGTVLYELITGRWVPPHIH